MTPNFKFLKLGIGVFFGVYSFILLFNLLFRRIILRVLSPEQFIRWYEGAPTLEVLSLNTNLLPFRQITEYLFRSHWFNTDIIVRNLFGSILIYIPLGIFLPLLFNHCRKISNIIMVSAICSFMIEFSQLVFRVGQFDVDTIILNTLGSIIGYGIFKGIWKLAMIKNELTDKKKLIIFDE